MRYRFPKNVNNESTTVTFATGNLKSNEAIIILEKLQRDANTDPIRQFARRRNLDQANVFNSSILPPQKTMNLNEKNKPEVKDVNESAPVLNSSVPTSVAKTFTNRINAIHVPETQQNSSEYSESKYNKNGSKENESISTAGLKGTVESNSYQEISDNLDGLVPFVIVDVGNTATNNSYRSIANNSRSISNKRDTDPGSNVKYGRWNYNVMPQYKPSDENSIPWLSIKKKEPLKIIPEKREQNSNILPSYRNSEINLKDTPQFETNTEEKAGDETFDTDLSPSNRGSGLNSPEFEANSQEVKANHGMLYSKVSPSYGNSDINSKSMSKFEANSQKVNADDEWIPRRSLIEIIINQSPLISDSIANDFSRNYGNGKHSIPGTFPGTDLINNSKQNQNQKTSFRTIPIVTQSMYSINSNDVNRFQHAETSNLELDTYIPDFPTVDFKPETENPQILDNQMDYEDLLQSLQYKTSAAPEKIVKITEKKIEVISYPDKHQNAINKETVLEHVFQNGKNRENVDSGMFDKTISDKTSGNNEAEFDPNRDLPIDYPAPINRENYEGVDNGVYDKMISGKAKEMSDIEFNLNTNLPINYSSPENRKNENIENVNYDKANFDKISRMNETEINANMNSPIDYSAPIEYDFATSFYRRTEHIANLDDLELSTQLPPRQQSYFNQNQM